ncbi:MAG: type II secretion system protein [Candidatus Levybacteria bacterium]|nr:type II secretion system protein [Candidatus Levybacteria bacterium]
MQKQKGATILEIILVMAIFATLFGFITISLLSSTAKASFQGALSVLIADIQSQQQRAISVDTDNGVYFTQNNYTVFAGSSYTPSNASNFVIALEEDLEFSDISLPNDSIIFEKRNGEAVGFSPNQHTVTIKNTLTNEQKTIQINRYGVITQIQ